MSNKEHKVVAAPPPIIQLRALDHKVIGHHINKAYNMIEIQMSHMPLILNQHKQCKYLSIFSNNRIKSPNSTLPSQLTSQFKK